MLLLQVRVETLEQNLYVPPHRPNNTPSAPWLSAPAKMPENQKFGVKTVGDL